MSRMSHDCVLDLLRVVVKILRILLMRVLMMQMRWTKIFEMMSWLASELDYQTLNGLFLEEMREETVLRVTIQAA